MFRHEGDIQVYERKIYFRFFLKDELMSELFYCRCKKVYDGVTHAGKLYPNAYLIMILIGTLKGSHFFQFIDWIQLNSI